MSEEQDYRTFREIHNAKLFTGCAWMVFVFIGFGLSYFGFGHMQPSLVRALVAAAGFGVGLYCSWEIYLLNYIEDAREFEKLKANPNLYPKRRPKAERTAKKFLKWLWDYDFFTSTLGIFLFIQIFMLGKCIVEIF